MALIPQRVATLRQYSSSFNTPRIHTHTHSPLEGEIVGSNSIRDESIVWVEMSSHHPAPREGGLPWALWMTLKGFVREDLTLLLEIMLY